MKEIEQLKKLKELSKKQDELRLAAEAWDENWKILISTILSARTRDEVTIPVSIKLFEKYSSIKKLSKASFEEISKIIKPVNFYRNKTNNVINCAKEIVEKYGSETPVEFDELIKFPGVGRKTANVFLSEIGNDTIGVDTHIAYISKKLDWTNNSNPEKIENDLKKIFPKKYWRRLNPILVRFGKTHTSRKQKDKILEEIKKIR